jgi:hypothetical protein
LALISSFLTCPGCGHISGYLGFLQRQKSLENTFQNQPRVALLRELSPEDCFVLQGTLAVSGHREEPLLIVAVSDRFHEREIVTTWTLRSPALGYAIFLPEGDYHLYIFADLDRNGYFAPHELIGRTAPGKPAQVKPDRAVDGILVEGPVIPLDFNRPRVSDLLMRTKVTVHSFKLESLGDEFFHARYGAMGLYHPTGLLAHTQGFIFGLEDFDENKTVVLFVHGMGGTPQDWKYIVEGLDRKRFQPFFFFYPSGLPLEKLGALLAQLIKTMDKSLEFRLSRLVVVGHSMGGLVGRSAINNLCRQGPPPYLKSYISFSAPYGGVEQARIATEKAPVVVPSWRDITPGSAFLHQMYQLNLPREVSFYLFFGYRNPSFFKSQERSDGEILLGSQLDARIGYEAFKTYGFDSTHVGILNSEKPQQEFNRALAAVVSEKRIAKGKVGTQIQQ